MPQPTHVQRLRKAFDTFLREAQQILAEVESEEAVISTSSPEIAAIKQAVAEHFHIPIALMDARIRRVEAVWPRHVAMYLAAESTTITWRQIGTAFNRDSDTVRHAYRAIKNAMDTSPRAKREVEQFLVRFPSVH